MPHGTARPVRHKMYVQQSSASAAFGGRRGGGLSISQRVPPGRLRAVSRLTKPHGNVGDKAAAAELANNL